MKRQRNMAQMKERNKISEKVLNGTETTTQLKTLVIRMLRELTVHSKIIKEGLKTTLSEIKKIHREPTVKRRRPWFKSTIWNVKKK